MSDDDSASEVPGERIAGRYQVLGELGSGVVLVVWLANDTVLDRNFRCAESSVDGLSECAGDAGRRGQANGIRRSIWSLLPAAGPLSLCR